MKCVLRVRAHNFTAKGFLLNLINTYSCRFLFMHINTLFHPGETFQITEFYCNLSSNIFSSIRLIFFHNSREDISFRSFCSHVRLIEQFSNWRREILIIENLFTSAFLFEAIHSVSASLKCVVLNDEKFGYSWTKIVWSIKLSDWNEMSLNSVTTYSAFRWEWMSQTKSFLLCFLKLLSLICS